MKLSVVIVNYNVKFFLEQCLKSVFDSGKNIDMEVFVVDNNSVDGSVQWIQSKFPEVKIIANKKNKGFSKANNQAIRQAKGKYILLLNPDTVVEDSTFEKVIAFMDKTTDAGALGVKMIDGKGKFLPESKRGLPSPWVAFYKVFGLSALFPKSKVFGKYHLGYLDQDKTHQVDVLSGAFMLLRNEALEKSGLLDESYFMYGEDIDLSYKITQTGYKNYYFPDTRIIHYKGESTKKSSINYVFVFYNAMIIFARKHFSKSNARLFSFFIHIAIYFRAFIAILNRFVKRIIIPAIDISIGITGIYFLKEYWEKNILGVSDHYYPPEFMLYFVPACIVIWLFSVYISGGYDKPVKLYRIVRGIGLGTVAILVIYALLPIFLRFSRGLILLGALWMLLSMLFTRILWNLIQHQQIDAGDSGQKRIAIIGKEKETQRVATMIRQSGSNDFLGYICSENKIPENKGFIGSLDQLNEIIKVYKINELIFCAGELSSQTIISTMSEFNKKRVGFKIAPAESIFIIGSNSIDTFDSFFTVNVNNIEKPANKRNKRIFDLLVTFVCIISFPVSIFAVKNKTGFIKNIIEVFFNRKSWVGYHPDGSKEGLPHLKKGVLAPGNFYDFGIMDQKTFSNLNALYAKDYRIDNDMEVIKKSVKRMGNRV